MCRNRALTGAWLALGLLLAAAGPRPALAEDAPSALPAAVARDLGLQAMAAGRPDIALALAEALVAADPTDSFALFLKANALFSLGDMDGARAAGRLSYRHAASPEQSYQAARLTALAAYNSNRFGAAQWWLRRAAEYAPEEARRALSVAEFNAVRRKNPLRVDLSFSLVPSDNVNNGSAGSFNVIDGVPYVGVLSPDAKALSGLIAEGGLDLTYRLSQDDSGSLWAGFSLFGQHITLSDSARRDLGDYPEPDLGAWRSEVSLRRQFARPDGVDSLSLGATLGLQQEGATDRQAYGRVTLGYSRALDTSSLLHLAVMAEQRQALSFQPEGDQVTALRGTWVRALANSDVISATLFASRFDTWLSGQSSTTFGGDLSYEFARDFGPLNLSLLAGAYEADYAGYTLATITVPGGRQDRTGYVGVEMVFPAAAYSGFAPVLTLRHQVTSSNVSRFDSTENSISLGVKSVF
jgi:tetratricopeptide (TPR) repeat protein